MKQEGRSLKEYIEFAFEGAGNRETPLCMHEAIPMRGLPGAMSHLALSYLYRWYPSAVRNGLALPATGEDSSVLPFGDYNGSY